jgi:TPR repeat protein
MRADEAMPRPGRIPWCMPVALATIGLAIGLLTGPMALAQDAAATPPAAQEPVPDLETLLALAKQGHPVAQFNLGVKYDFGQGVEKDPAQAIHWYRLAAAQGHGGAQFNLGGMYFEGLGVKRDLVRATMWFTLSAEAGVGGASKNRAILARAMSPEQQAQARTLALECRLRAFKDCEP